MLNTNNLKKFADYEPLPPVTPTNIPEGLSNRYNNVALEEKYKKLLDVATRLKKKYHTTAGMNNLYNTMAFSNATQDLQNNKFDMNSMNHGTSETFFETDPEYPGMYSERTVYTYGPNDIYNSTPSFDTLLKDKVQTSLNPPKNYYKNIAGGLGGAGLGYTLASLLTDNPWLKALATGAGGIGGASLFNHLT